MKRFLTSPRFGMVLGILSVLWEAFWLVGAPIGIGLPQDRHQYFAWGFVALAVSAIQAVWASQKRVSDLERQLAPKFEIVFLPENNTDSRPYLQTLTFGKFEEPGLPMVKMEDRRYRVGILSLSKAIVPSVHVVLSRCEPAGNFIHVGHRLQVMDSDPPEAERDLPPSANGSPTLWFDVVNEVTRSDRRPRDFHFCFANPKICGPVHSGEYEITLRCEGAGVSHERSFAIRKVWDDQLRATTRLSMEPLECSQPC
jgi:hypothetical protein